MVNRRVNVVRQIALGLAKILDLGGLAIQTRLEDRVHHHVRARVRRHRAHFHAHALLIADRDADHRAAVHGRSLDLVGRFEMRVEPAIRVHAGIEHQADVVRVRENAIDE